ncbi:MFS transporter [Sporosarcina sp. ANT_H38]|uniref:MFS transporter n=1 Tax=Sporosarcina sp. ANT_H38 TaxID=2597358 RepID=UPI0011F3F761|nr:MFS transporter [Sporosarcina sp. ANT_H38]KAA0941041.1 MFS transporter [Sporosarcina sp. ANT_H38]
MKSASFRFLWIGQSMANLGDIFYIVGLISILYASTDSPFTLALVPFLSMFGRFISGMISPLLLNRYPLKKLLVYSQVSKTLLLYLLALILVFHMTSSVLVLLSFVFTIAFLDGWAAPASQAMLPRLVPKNELVKANSFFSVIYETVNLGGWAIGGLIVAFLSGQTVILITVVLYLMATLLMTKIIDPTEFQRKISKGRQIGELKEGWQIVWRNPLYKSLYVIIVFEAVANVVWIASILYVFVTEILGETEAWWGYINTSFFIGMVVGGIICSRFTLIFEKKLKCVLIIFSFGISIMTFLFGLTEMAWLSLIFAGLNGVFQQLKAIASNTFLQKSASTEELPKIYAAQSALVSLLFAVSSLLFGALAEIGNVRITFIISAALLGIAAIYTVIRHRRFAIEESNFPFER